ncbi:hypothetical protein D3C72_2218270 [compost metagenome]
MRRDAGVEQLIQADQQQGFDIGVGLLERLLQQTLGQGREPWLPACGAERQVLGQATVTHFDLVQLRRQRAVQRSLAAEYCRQGAGGCQTWIH